VGTCADAGRACALDYTRPPPANLDETKHLSEPDPQRLLRTLRPHPDVVARRAGADTVLVQLSRNEVFSLNGTGGRLWELLADGVTPSDAHARMLEEFDVSPDALQREIDAFIEMLLREQLVIVDET